MHDMRAKYQYFTEDITLTRVSNPHSQQFVQDITYDLDGMTAGLVTDWIFDKQSAASQGRSSSDFRVIVLKIGKGAAANKFVQDMSLDIHVNNCVNGEEIQIYQ